jgi:nicotinate-nucleotide pyrophosphorylase (carboxylating)
VISLHQRLESALDEDLGPGDLTTDAVVPRDQIGRAVVVAKEPLVVSGQEVARAAYEVVGRRLGTLIVWRAEVADGEVVEPDTVLATVHGNLRGILIGERLALNLMMRACGVASHVRRCLQDVGPTTFRAVDTRKTTPLWRDLEKAAVRHGGGHNHRFGLFDGVLIKDNHIAAAGGVTEAVRRARLAAHHMVRVEVEVSTLEQLDEALTTDCDGLLLDNMDDATLIDAIAKARAVRPEVFLEASGNMHAARLKRIAGFGLDLVSVGGFIHQARWADLSMRVSS